MDVLSPSSLLDLYLGSGSVCHHGDRDDTNLLFYWPDASFGLFNFFPPETEGRDVIVNSKSIKRGNY